MSAVLLLALNIFRQSAREFVAACAFAVPALIGRWLLQIAPGDGLTLFVLVCWIVFLAFAVVIILRYILTTKSITYDTISGAICGYLLFGVMYAFAYAIIDFFYPGSLFVRSHLLPVNVPAKLALGRYVYFSFVTLASLGYGDITPLSSPACAFSAIEGIAGQFYIAVLIARLVSLHSSKWGNG